MSEVGLLLPGWPESPQTARPNPAGRKFKIMKEWSKRADWPAPEQRLGKEMWRERGREIERERERDEWYFPMSTSSDLCLDPDSLSRQRLTAPPCGLLVVISTLTAGALQPWL